MTTRVVLGGVRQINFSVFLIFCRRARHAVLRPSSYSRVATVLYALSCKVTSTTTNYAFFLVFLTKLPHHVNSVQSPENRVKEILQPTGPLQICPRMLYVW